MCKGTSGYEVDDRKDVQSLTTLRMYIYEADGSNIGSY